MAAAALDVEYCLGYYGSAVWPLPLAELCWVAGCGVQFYNLETGAQRFTWAPRQRPVAHLTFDAHRTRFAFSNRGTVPLVNVYSLPDRELLCTIDDFDGVEIADLAFDRSGTRLAVLEGLPNFKLHLYSVESPRPMLLGSSDPVLWPVTRVSFNPLDNAHLCTHGPGRVAFWLTEGLAGGGMALNPKEIAAPVPERPYRCHAWSVTGEVVVGGEDGVYLFDPMAGTRDLVPSTTAYDAGAVAVSRHHVVVASMDGTLRFLSHAKRQCIRTLSVPVAQVRECQFLTDWSGLVVGGADGRIAVLHLPGYAKPHLTDADFQQLTARVEVVADFHGGPITACVHVPQPKLLATVGADTTLRLWDPATRTLKTKTAVGPQPTCLATSPLGLSSSALAVGSGTGMVTILSVTEPGGLRVVHRSRLARSPVLAVEFAPAAPLLCVAVAPASLWWLHARTGAVIAVSVAPVTGLIRSLSWAKDQTRGPQMIFVSDSDCHVFSFAAPDPSTTTAGTAAPEIMNLKDSWKLNHVAVRLLYCRNFAEKHHVLTLAADRTLRVAALPKPEGAHLPGDRVRPGRTLLTYSDFNKIGTAIALAPDDCQVLACGSDGTCWVRNLQPALVGEPPKSCEAIPARTFQRHTPFRGGIASGAWSADGQCVYTVGDDGFFFCLRVKGTPPSATAFKTEVPEAVLPVADDEDVYADKQRKAADHTEYTANQPARYKILAKARALAADLAALKKANEQADEAERLPTEEFIPDSLKAEADRAAEGAIAAVREENRWRDVARAHRIDRLKRECYDSADPHLTVLHGLSTDTEVPNCHLRRLGPREDALMRKVAFLRRVQLEEQRRRQDPYFLDAVIEPARPRSDSTRRVSVLRSGDDLGAAPEGVAGAGPSALELLYSPFEVYTQHRAFTQMWLLKGAMRAVQRAFNAQHASVLSQKRAAIARIAERNLRIHQILAELGWAEAIVTPALRPSEQPESLLAVLDSELDPALATGPPPDAAARRGDDEGDTFEKGLRAMMDGKLERDTNVVQVIEQPEFMERKAQEEWTDEEVKAAKEYEQRLRRRAEDEERRRRQLEGELKGLRRETHEAAAAFDAALAALATEKLETDQTVYEMETRVIRLAQYLAHREDFVEKAAHVDEVTDGIQAQLAHSRQRIVDAKRELEAKAELAQRLVQEERAAERRFRQSFGDNDDILELLLKLLKRQSKPQALDEDSAMDPFAGAEVINVPESQEGPLPKPPGLSDAAWVEFLRYRQQHLDRERQAQTLSEEVQRLHRRFQRLKTDYETLQAQSEKALQRLSTVQETMERDRYNVDYLRRYRQDQVELERGAVATDFGDAVLIPVQRIHDVNARIRAAGMEKVEILKEMQEFRKGIRVLEWKNEVLDYRCGSLELEYRHLHTMRVTRAMQEFLKGGGEDPQLAERARLMRKLALVRSAYEEKVQERKRALARIQRAAGGMAGENGTLERSTAEVDQEVRAREETVALQTAEGSRDRATQAMRELRASCQLEDVARSQQDQIVALRTRIDRLREQTFPSFAVVAKRVVGGPDEAIP